MDDALREIVNTMQVRGEPQRKWFTSVSFDLFVWLDESGSLVGFQLCYGKPISEKALTWRAEKNFLTHTMVDDGETSGGERYKSAPIFIQGGAWNAGKVLEDFLRVSVLLPPEIKALVVNQLEQVICGGQGMTFTSTVTPSGAHQ